MNIITLNDNNFEQEVIKSAIPVLVDFWAEWCGPCKMISSVITEIANDNVGKYKICKCNIEEGERITVEYKIRAVPTLIFFKDGKNTFSVSGMTNKQNILQQLEKLL